MGFTEEEFFRTPMRATNDKWVVDYYASKFDSLPEEVKDTIRKGGNYEFEEAVQQVFQHAKSVLLQKHADYGPKNISQSPGGPLNGLRVRMWDKFARINHLIDSGAEPENESLRDSFLDMANYALIAMLVLDEDWPEG